MACTNNNTSCNCTTNECGCKTSTDDVVYQGPSLDCIGVVNCDTLTSVFESIDSFICGPGMAQTIINNIVNNISLYNQFTTIVNNTVDCNTVWDCQEIITTTTTTTVTLDAFCNEITVIGKGILYWTDAHDNAQALDVRDITVFICAQFDSIAFAGPGFINIVGNLTYCTDNDQCLITTTTTTTLAPTTTTTTTLGACVEYTWEAFGENSSDLEYTNCLGDRTFIYAIDVTNNSGTICVYPDTVPIWNPSPSTGFHEISTMGDPCIS